jgi:hypothetical protein
MAAFNKFNSFVEALAEKVHNLGSDTLKVMLTNTAPVATNAVKADITEIASGNGYVSGGNTATVTSSAQTSGTYKLVLGDPATWTASGGPIPSAGDGFRYAVLFNDSATNKELIGWWDYGSSVTLADGESFAVDFDPTTGVLTIA